MNKNIEVEGGEIAILNSHGDLAIIPKDKRNWVKQKLSEGCHDCIDSLVETLPIASQYAQDGSVYPPNTKVKVNQDNQIKEYDINSKEYRDLYNSGKLTTYDKTTDTYIAPPLEDVPITVEAPQWLKYKRNLEEQYTKDWYIDNILPKFSRSMGVSVDNMNPNNVEQYNEFINNKLAEGILKRNPKVGSSNNERLAWYNSLSEKEREIVNNSYSTDKFSPAVRAYMESQSNEAKKYGILETFRDVDKLAQSVEGTPERFRIFPNAENNYENYVNPLMWIGDMAKGLGNVPKDIKEENYLKAASSVASPLLGGALGGVGTKTLGQFVKNTFLPLGGLEENIVKGGKNLVGNVLVGKLSKADKVIDATKVGSKVLNKTDDVLSKIGTPLDRPIDIHDIRKKYHNNLILQPDEIKLLNKEGKGNRANYRNISGTDIVGKIHIDDTKPKKINFDRNSIEELLFGKDYSTEKVPTKSNGTTLNDIKLNSLNKSVFEENELNIKSYKQEVESLLKDLKTDISSFERTPTSMKADKWLEDWFNHPETKKSFINYGGTEEEWANILNTLENPIRSSVKYGKGQPGGVYMDVFKQASIPINAKVDVGVHEGIHKTGLLLKKSNPILNELWNDFTDAVREIPTESYPEIFRLRYNMGLKPGQKIDMETLDKGLKTIQDGYSIPNKIKDKNKLLDIINKAPALVPFLGTYLQSQQQNKNEQ